MKGKNIDIVDFHSHILPCADHGSDSLETSRAQLALASECGITRIIATPHFYPHKHTLDAFLKRRDSAAGQLFSVMTDNDPQIKLGAEVLLCEGFENFVGIEKLCVQGTNTLLIELPFADFRTGYCEAARKLLRMGFDVVLAHVDRYPKDNIERMIDVGVTRMQINADALAKTFKQKHLFSWIDDGLVVALGSDIHGRDAKAYKRFLKAADVLADAAGYVASKSDEIWNNTNKKDT